MALLDTENVNKWLTLGANIAVLLGITFLVIEIRQSNRIAIAATEIAVSDQFKTINNLVLANDDVAQLLVKAWNADAEFSAVETEKLYAFFYTHLITWTIIEIAYDNGMVTHRTLEVALEDIRIMFNDYPALRPVARETIDSFGTDSRVFAAIREELAESE